MSIETHINIRATFGSEDNAKNATKELKKSLRKHEHDLGASLDALNPIENQAGYKDHIIKTEEAGRKKNTLNIYAYTYVSEEPTWFAQSLSNLGAKRIFIRAVSDGHVRNYYFLDGEQVPKKKFDGNKPKKQLSAKDIEINKNLFLPEDRVNIKAKLISSWFFGDIYESIALKLISTNGDEFYHVGKGKLVDAFYNSEKDDYDKEIIVEFDAAFERGKLEDKYASFAKRPTKVNVC